MKKLLLASNNRGKINEIKQLFSGIYDEVLSLKDAGIKLDVEEDGRTFEENAIKKALAAMQETGMDALADDSGLEVEALGGAPGIFSARFSEKGATDRSNNEKLLALLQGVPTEKRGARFTCAVALARKGRPVLTVLGHAEGIIADAPRGDGGFGYDPLFYSPGHGMTFGQMPPEMKNAISHRSRALKRMRELLEQEQS
ncbi:MAG: XTP/dITP diphosphatase [Bacillota bacterium]|nr:XTP/dITP diphosphatase [Bacillota bacterium]